MCYSGTTGGEGGTGCAVSNNFGPAGSSVTGSIGAMDGNLPEVAGPYTDLYVTMWFKVTIGAEPCDGHNGLKGWQFMEGSTWAGGLRTEFKPCNSKQWAGGTQCGLSPNKETGVWMQWDGGWASNARTNAGTGDPRWHSGGISDHACGADWTAYNDGNWHRITIAVHGGSIPAAEKGQTVWINGTMVFNSVGAAPVVVDVWGFGVDTDWEGNGSLRNKNSGICEGFGCGGMAEPFDNPYNGISMWGTHSAGDESGAAAAQPELTVWFDDLIMWVEN